MEENQLSQNQSFEESYSDSEPVAYTENSERAAASNQTEQLIKGGQSFDPQEEELILGKFKSVEDLTKAYQELEKLKGSQSDELGSLRKKCADYDIMEDQFRKLRLAAGPDVKEYHYAREKYDSENYFKNSSFEELYKEAFFALGRNLDSDKFVKLLEAYVGSRIYSYEKSKAAGEETQNIINSMGYSNNPNTSITPPKKSLDEMTPKEIDELLDRLV